MNDVVEIQHELLIPSFYFIFKDEELSSRSLYLMSIPEVIGVDHYHLIIWRDIFAIRSAAF